MSEHNLACDDDSLVALLSDELSHEESESTLDHLENCAKCQQRLSDLVASRDEWQQAAKMISTGYDRADSVQPIFKPSQEQYPVVWTESMAEQLLSPASHPEMLGRLGRYEVERLVGSGGMGVVFKAFDSELNRPVAIKVLAPYLASSGSARKRFSREARAAAAVVHQHVVPIHNVETDRESPFIVMQFVSGESLQDRIDRDGPLELCEGLRIGMQVADGLSAAHNQGLVHRDIKPSNILLEEDVDRALISDFGLARAADDASLTRAGVYAGTPQYMSPEQASGQSVDERSDLFSLGSMLYTMCTGRPPFRAESSLGVMRRITETEPTPIREIKPDVPDWLCTLITKLMAKRIDERPRSAIAVRELLEQCLSHVQQPSAVPVPETLARGVKKQMPPFYQFVVGALFMLPIAALTAALLFTQLTTQNPTLTKQDIATDVSVTESAREDYQPSDDTRQVIDELIAKVEKLDPPEWTNTDQLVAAFREAELKKGISERICKLLGQIASGQLEDAPQTLNELQGLQIKLRPMLGPTETTYEALAKIATAVWPLVLNGYPAEFNDTVVDLTEPYVSIRKSDRIAVAGSPTEPLGWDLQAVHALALARAGDVENALKENRTLEKKIRVNLEKSRLPNLQSTFLGVSRTNRALLQQLILQEAFIMACNDQIEKSVQVSSTAGSVELKDPTNGDHLALQQILSALARERVTP